MAVIISSSCASDRSPLLGSASCALTDPPTRIACFVASVELVSCSSRRRPREFVQVQEYEVGIERHFRPPLMDVKDELKGTVMSSGLICVMTSADLLTMASTRSEAVLIWLVTLNEIVRARLAVG